jgi:hypothetical protein
MLTRELAIARIENGRVYPDRLTMASHANYPTLAERMIAIYENGIHKTRQELHREIANILEEDPACPIRRIGAFCKLLDECGRFDRGKPKRASELRRQVFTLAAQYHPLVTHPESMLEHQEMIAKQSIAPKLGMEWPELQRRLYEDLIENHRLRAFHAPAAPVELLSRYNVAQTQAALLNAVSIRIEATTDWKWILRYAKLAGLLHRIYAIPGGYRIELDGPASVLRRTHRYGASMAKFLPGLLSCQGWNMVASMRAKRENGFSGPVLELSDRSGLRTSVKRQENVDSELEMAWIQAWGAESHGGWSLIREGEVLVRGQRAFVPDFILLHESGRRVSLEIAGFWTPEYIEHRAEALSLFAGIPMIVAIPKGNLEPWQGFPWSSLHQKVIFGKRLKPEQVVEVLQSLLARD